MKKNLFFGIITIIVLSVTVGAQGSIGSEDELKAKANELFEAQDYKEAKLMYAQLLSLYPKDPTYNYRFGACVLQTEADKTKPMKYLNFAASKANVDPLAYFYLGKAHHLNYEFAQAVKQYSKFKNKANNEQKEKYNVERQIEMCKNGNSLLSKLNELQVLERQSIAAKDFYRIYDEAAMGGKIIVKPEQFKSKYDKKIDDKSVIFLANDASEVYYSSYGKKGENGKDIYKAIKIGNGEWSEGVNLDKSINTEFDEDFAYIKPDGKTLYFASKGHSSMGGYDLFKSEMDDATGQWTAPENLDFAFNSADNDFMFVPDRAGITAYFSSNRTNEFGEVTVYKVLIDRAPAQLSVITGIFVAESNPDQKKAKITVIDKLTQETVGVYETDDKGNYAIEIAKNGGDYQFNVETNEVDPIHSGVVSIPEQDEFEVLGQELRLVGEGDAQILVIKNIFDGTASNTAVAGGGPSISSELIRMKANLEVNYNSNDLASLQKKQAEKQVEEETVETQNSNYLPESAAEEEFDAEASSNKELLPDAEEDLVEGSITEEPVSVVAIEEQLSALKMEQNARVDEKQKAIGLQYASAVQLQQNSSTLFNEVDEMENSGADSADVVRKRKEAGETALRASIAAELAQNIEASINEDLSSINDFETVESSINEAIGSNEVQKAANLLQELKANKSSSATTQEVINISLTSIAERKALADKKIQNFSAKSNSFMEEKGELEKQLSNLTEEVDGAKGKKKEEFTKNKEATELDLQDVDYQFGLISENLREAKLSKKSLITEKDEILEASNRFKGNTEEVATITDEERTQLFDELKRFRDENKLAYSPGNELYQTLEDDGTEELIASDNFQELEEEVAANVGEEEFDLTEEQEIPELTSAVRESTLASQSLSSINSNYSSELNEVEAIEDDELKLAKTIQVYDNWLSDLKVKKQKVSDTYDAEVDETKRLTLEQELSQWNSTIIEKEQVKRDAELELAKRASGEFVADQESISNSNQITETSIVDDGFTSLKFDQQLQATSAASAIELIGAKKALYKAGELSNRQKEVQESAYTLPSVAERTAAFNEANKLKKESEAKQIEAANKFAAFNLNEYQSNKVKIDKANELDERYTTEGRELAILLAEEASNFFTEAAILRSEVNESDRLTQKEVNLQKAYDFEVLALQRQKEALKKLGMVVSEVFSSKTTGSKPSKVVKPFIQVIYDEEVLAVVEAPKAKTAAEAKTAEVITLNFRIERLDSLSETMEDGPKVDSILAVKETLVVEKNQALKQAALYYERERQINEGLVDVAPLNNKAENLVLSPKKPIIEIMLDSVDIDGGREQLLLNSENFKTFANNRELLVSQTKAAEVVYQEAVSLAQENERLQKQAIIEKNMAKVVKDEEEKQRLIKSAQVIESTIAANEVKIQSLNNSIKLKNTLVENLAKKDKEYLAQLDNAEKQEFIHLVNESVTDIQQVAIADNTPNLTNDVIASTDQVESEEPAKAVLDLNPLDTESGLDLPEATVVDNSDDSQEVIADDNNTGVEPFIEELAEINTPAVNESVNESPIVSIEYIDVVPRQVKQAIFVTLDGNESAYNESKPIPTKTSLPEGVVYKVQVGAFRNPIPASTFKGFAPIMAEPSGTGITRYTAGLFVNENNATAARNEIRKIGYPDAFVVAFLNGERISISIAREEAGSTGSAASVTSFPNASSGSSGSPNPTANNALATDVAKVAGGSTEALPAAFNSIEVEAVVNTETIEGVYYTVQIGVFSTPVKKGIFDYEGLNVVALSNGLYRYHAGTFSNLFGAADLKNEITATIPDAFVTAYYNGKRISLSEASKLKNK